MDVKAFPSVIDEVNATVKTFATTDTLVDRLRGIYTIPVNDGAGLLNGKDTFTNVFQTPPIQHEAANEIERLRKLIKLAECQHLGCGGSLSPSEIVEAMRKVLRDGLEGL